ncbi:MAG: response regulator [Pseudomonadota bacterium]|nr:response regulator [Pseudomonadota bacterium]MEC8579356.1 response regulator [Pseudomonadota bacterium]
MDDLRVNDGLPRPTASRPLLGLTVLVVEDSRFACDAVRLLCIRSGARIRRADCLKSARRHLEVYRPSVIIVDMGLPDGSGADLLAELKDAKPRVSVILATSGDPFAADCAIAAGADGFLEKPINSVGLFQQTILGHLPPERRPRVPRSVPDERIKPDPIAYRDDIAHAVEVLGEEQTGQTLDYVSRFLSGVAHSAGDAPLADAADRLFQARVSGVPVSKALTQVSGLLHDRLEEKIAI